MSPRRYSPEALARRLEASREWKANHPEQVRTRWAAYYETHRDELLPKARARANAWRLADPERAREAQRRRSKTRQRTNDAGRVRVAGLVFYRKSTPPEVIAIAEAIKETKSLLREMKGARK